MAKHGGTHRASKYARLSKKLWTAPDAVKLLSDTDTSDSPSKVLALSFSLSHTPKPKLQALWFTTSLLQGGRCRKAMLGVWPKPPSQPQPAIPHSHLDPQSLSPPTLFYAPLIQVITALTAGVLTISVTQVKLSLGVAAAKLKRKMRGRGTMKEQLENTPTLQTASDMSATRWFRLYNYLLPCPENRRRRWDGNYLRRVSGWARKVKVTQRCHSFNLLVRSRCLVCVNSQKRR